MAKMTMVQALNLALQQEMEKTTVLLFWEKMSGLTAACSG
jgi:hypothetical protein